MKIFIITHKEFEKPQLEDIYIPIQVGAEKNNQLGYLTDNSGIHISSKNANYCELTGLYWIWKNVKDDMVGICHYRRYFVTSLGKALNVILNKQCFYYKEEHFLRALKNHDIIVHNYTFFPMSVGAQFLKHHNNFVWAELEKIIKQEYNSYYFAFLKVTNGHKVHLLNMFFARKEILDTYCTWLFEILFKLEKRVAISLTVKEERVYGYVAERLLDVWIIKNHLKVKNTFTINTEKNVFNYGKQKEVHF